MTVKSESAQALLEALKNPFDPKFVKVRVGATSRDKKKGIALFYLDAREVEKRLDEVCGFENWQTKLLPVVSNGLIGTVCELSIKMPSGEWITKSDGGEPSKSSPFKGSCSDSLKRAAVQFGVGRYLYYIPNQWYPINEYKQFENKPELPKWATPRQTADWEEIAIAEYDPSKDVDLDNVIFESGDGYSAEETEAIMRNARANRQSIIANAIRRRAES